MLHKDSAKGSDTQSALLEQFIGSSDKQKDYISVLCLSSVFHKFSAAQGWRPE